MHDECFLCGPHKRKRPLFCGVGNAQKQQEKIKPKITRFRCEKWIFPDEQLPDCSALVIRLRLGHRRWRKQSSECLAMSVERSWRGTFTMSKSHCMRDASMSVWRLLRNATGLQFRRTHAMPGRRSPGRTFVQLDHYYNYYDSNANSMATAFH